MGLRILIIIKDFLIQSNKAINDFFDDILILFFDSDEPIQEDYIQMMEIGPIEPHDGFYEISLD